MVRRMSDLTRLATLGLATMLIAAACSPSGLDVETTADPDAPIAEDDPTPAPPPDPTATATPEPPPEPTATATPEPPPEPAPLVLEVGVSAIGDVAVGTAADEAIERLTALLGPGDDTGWIEGCPLDGPDLNERYLSWGGLTADFRRGGGAIERFDAWRYRIDLETLAGVPGGPGPDQVVIPGGFTMGDDFETVVLSYGETPVVDDVFGVPLHFGANFTLIGRDPVTATPIIEVGTPFVGFCE